MAKSNFQKFMANNATMLSQAMTQRRLQLAGVVIDKDLLEEGFYVPPNRKFPKWVNQFVDAQMKRFDYWEQYNKNHKSV